MSENKYEQEIGQAWALHRNAQFEESVATFQTILRNDPENIDANYGIGLALRATGRQADAIQHFQSAQTGLRIALQNIRARAEAEGQHIANNLSTTLDDRYMMLLRMTAQRLEELGVAVELSDEEKF
jgi:tetratricopeptide (TPR) repeat protein